MHHVFAVVIGFLCSFVVFEYIPSMAIAYFERKNAIIAEFRKQLKEASRSTSVPGPTMEGTVDLEKGMLEEGSRTESPRGMLAAHDYPFPSWRGYGSGRCCMLERCMNLAYDRWISASGPRSLALTGRIGGRGALSPCKGNSSE